jgi:YidC/Oxa1 family membrane protein insertase
VILTTRGAAVQQVTLTRFDEANRLGREVKRADGTPQSLRLIPGVVQDRKAVSLTDIHDNPSVAVVPDLTPGVVSDPKLRAVLAEPSYLILHYPSKDDPARQPDTADRMNANHPSTELGDRNWTLVSSGKTDAGWQAVFETDLDAPYFLKLRKTYSLRPREYHVTLKFDIEPLAGRSKDRGEFRYQIVGAHGLPIEGEWYTATFRNVMAGWTTPAGGAVRSFEDAVSIQVKAGGDKVVRGPNTFSYAAVATQYFASAVAIDDDQPKDVRERMWDYVRPTREPAPWDDNREQLFLADVTVRAASGPVVIGPGETVSHRYLIYDGPVKVAQLWELADTPTRKMAVDPELVERYLDKLHLRTLTDYQSPNFFGRLASFLWWSDLVIFFTNLMHWGLGVLHGIVPIWGVDIILLTVCVRLALFAPSRYQQAAMAKYSAKIAALKPELDKIQAKYKDDFYALNQAKTELLRAHGATAPPLLGCLPLIAQMPILMGLYFCLQESVFFRLDPFLWVPNLAAPDMTAWWSEQIPGISWAESLGRAFPPYLGPYLNVLPVIACALIFLQQKVTMPPPTDEQQEMQQKMMKFMVIMMAVFFYKVPAGLCIYFICGTLWALGERKFIPKPPTPTVGPTPATPAAPAAAVPSVSSSRTASKPTTEAPAGGGFLSKMRAKLEEVQRQAEEQTQRQIRNNPPPGDRNRGGNDRRDKKKKRK